MANQLPPPPPRRGCLSSVVQALQQQPTARPARPQPTPPPTPPAFGADTPPTTPTTPTTTPPAPKAFYTKLSNRTTFTRWAYTNLDIKARKSPPSKARSVGKLPSTTEHRRPG